MPFAGIPTLEKRLATRRAQNSQTKMREGTDCQSVLLRAASDNLFASPCGLRGFDESEERTASPSSGNAGSRPGRGSGREIHGSIRPSSVPAALCDVSLRPKRGLRPPRRACVAWAQTPSIGLDARTPAPLRRAATAVWRTASTRRAIRFDILRLFTWKAHHEIQPNVGQSAPAASAANSTI